jgi:hypothetical protein
MTAAAFKPGIYEMDETVYHADPVPGGSLSSSEARKLLPPSCPARFRWEKDNPPPPKDHLELGSAAHQLVLGAGPGLVVVHAEDWRTKAAREHRDAARAEGKIPLLTGEHVQVLGMAAAIRAHPVARALFDPERGGKPEQNLFWQDPESGIMRRARLDWLPQPQDGKRLVIGDYKTTADASPAAIRKHVANFGYYMQASWYLDAVTALGLDEAPSMLFVFQEKQAPYLVIVAELDEAAIATGRERNALACEIFRDCTEAGIWPGYSTEIELISLPPWAARDLEDILL